MNINILFTLKNLKQFAGLRLLVEMTKLITNYTKKVAKEHSIRIFNLQSSRTKGFSTAPLI